MEFGNIFKNAWKTLWEHKVILWFGFLMMIPSLLMGPAMGIFFLFINEKNFPFFFDPYASVPEINPALPILFMVAMFGFIIFSYAMMTLSFAGVLKGTFDLEGKEDTISFGELWRTTLAHFRRFLFNFYPIWHHCLFIFPDGHNYRRDRGFLYDTSYIPFIPLRNHHSYSCSSCHVCCSG